MSALDLVEAQPRRQEADGYDDGLDHLMVCYDDDTALCGKDISDAPEMDPYSDPEQPCVVCYEMNELERPCAARCRCDA